MLGKSLEQEKGMSKLKIYHSLVGEICEHEINKDCTLKNIGQINVIQLPVYYLCFFKY